MMESSSEKMIGIIGGLGPAASVDLAQKINDQTLAQCDQDHVSVALLSLANSIPDRTSFITGRTDTNPADVMTHVLRQLASIGVTVSGLPCVTAHVPEIFGVMQDNIKSEEIPIRLLSMIAETVRHIHTAYPDVKKVGILSTTVTAKWGLFSKALKASGLDALTPDDSIQAQMVDPAIFDEEYGIKAKSNPVSQIARQGLLSAISHLESRGAEVIVLGCTELPLAIPERQVGHLPMIDPTLVLARALIREVNPDKVRSL